MELSDDTKNALVQLLARSINDKLQKGTIWPENEDGTRQQPAITHTNIDDNNGTIVSPAKWNAATLAYPKQLCTAITGSAGVANGKLVLQIWLGYDVRPEAASNTARIPFDEMLAGVDDTGSNGPYPVVFESGTTPDVAYFALEPGGSEPTTSGSEAPKYPIYDTDISPFPILGAGTIVT